MIDPARPFLLFDDARAGGGPALLYADPFAIIETRDPGAVRGCLDRLRDAQAAGHHAAGFLSYEAGYALEPRLARLAAPPPEDAPPLLWFGLFDAPRAVRAEDILPAASARAGAPRPRIEPGLYGEGVHRIQEHILAGDIYQANYTFQADVPLEGDPLALYAAIRGRARAGHGGIVHIGSHWLLSFSPELFFTLEDGQVTARPMKGTARRHADPLSDAEAMRMLRSDEKQRAENLMIVDLLRNDLSRISRPGSVKVPDLFTVETYPTVHQMTSTVTAAAKDGIGAFDIVEAIFPCGSITGAPKIRAMEIIAEQEREPRGVYTGSIGWAAPDGRASFNVAIRTLTLTAGSRMSSLGLGSGIVADSRAGDEWRECLAKGAFVSVGDD
ncbi:aminodeoxychorismate synthase component I [Allosphingosinicella flava]|uniref:Aminodeoxychorismate synthase component I n=1 Tax=Allosphingosinicella flava TaxID=2771430 RepID=A0A7T2GMN6_9SPHN|nr:aminodeoxychorismate synthase component I [Sphingosinicella flava]QPQ56328.1 aminodeoxychorismate synthase component I [Sphingosinicella flava]